MIVSRRDPERGRSKLEWLDSRHTFSFGDYYDPQHMGFGHLRVINEDRVAPAAGFGTHSHRDMEIVTFVLEGELAHEDSTGTSSVIRVGDVQRMSAGTGIRHSEYNASPTEAVHFLQIWILPAETGIAPGYEQRAFDLERERGNWVLVVAPDGRNGAVRVHQDSRLSVARLGPGQEITYRVEPGRRAWVHLSRGSAALHGNLLHAGDGAAISDEPILRFEAVDAAELLLFDLS